MIVGHSETEDYEYLQRLLDRGSYLGNDRFGADNVADPAAAAQRGRPTHAQRLRWEGVFRGDLPKQCMPFMMIGFEGMNMVEDAIGDLL